MGRVIFASLAAIAATLTIPIGFGGSANANTAAPVYPEQARYCQPVMRIFERHSAGTITREAMLAQGRAAAKGCEATNKVGSYLSLALIEGAAGNRSEALPLVRAALALAPDYSEAHRRLCALTTGAEAETACKKAIELAPKSALAHASMGNLRLNRKQYSDAIISYTTSLAIEPRYEAALINRGLARANLNDTAGSLADYEAADLMLSDKHLDAGAVAIGKARALAKLNRRDQAISSLAARMAVAPKDVTARNLKWDLMNEAGQTKKLFVECDAVATASPNDKAAKNCMKVAAEAARKNGLCTRTVRISKGQEEVSAGSIDNRTGTTGSRDRYNYASFNQLTYQIASNSNAKALVKVNFDFDRVTNNVVMASAGMDVNVDTSAFYTDEDRRFIQRDAYVGTMAALDKHKYASTLEISSGGYRQSASREKRFGPSIDGNWYFPSRDGVMGATPKDIAGANVMRDAFAKGKITIKASIPEKNMTVISGTFSMPNLESDRQILEQAARSLMTDLPVGICGLYR